MLPKSLIAAAIAAGSLIGALSYADGLLEASHRREDRGAVALPLSRPAVDQRRTPDAVRAHDSARARWPDRRSHPIRVWIRPSSDLRDWTPSYADEVYAAFDEWDALLLPVTFKYVADSADAEVRVSWISAFKEPISGRAHWTRTDEWWVTAGSIILAVRGRTDDAVLEDDEMRAIALHEIGHVLGLGHTHDLGSIMAPRVRVRSLSEEDKATARLLYSLPPARSG